MTSKKDDPTQANTADSKLEKDIGEAIVMLRRQAHMTQEDLRRRRRDRTAATYPKSKTAVKTYPSESSTKSPAP